MAVRQIIQHPDSRLRKMSTPIEHFDESTKQLIQDLTDTMFDRPNGIGLASAQIAVNKRATVISVERDKEDVLVLINPEIIKSAGSVESEEGCLSVEGIYDTVTRAETVTVRAFDENGKQYERSAEGLLARAIQHEIDHMDGILFIDKLSPLKRAMALKRLEKYRRSHKS